ncbi:hypothetical protein Rcae01_05102 [Novipirellula caenicola]|uniref:Uncharacterized protein n=1 Tax=Novipirellula caenicola TaxID=1536901 RepID=A0ABP9W0F1_9BACT
MAVTPIGNHEKSDARNRAQKMQYTVTGRCAMTAVNSPQVTLKKIRVSKNEP